MAAVDPKSLHGKFPAPREHVEVDTRFGRIPVKVARMNDRTVNAAPEYEACRAAARAHGAPLKEVFAAALVAWERTAGNG